MIRGAEARRRRPSGGRSGAENHAGVGGRLAAVGASWLVRAPTARNMTALDTTARAKNRNGTGRDADLGGLPGPTVNDRGERPHW